MKAKFKWGVVIGKPKKEAWKHSLTQPFMGNVGQWYGLNCPILFDSRKDAREQAKHLDKFNVWWHHHAKKFS